MYQDLMMDAHIEEMFPYQPDHHLQYSQIDIIQNLNPFKLYRVMRFFICFGKAYLCKDQQVMMKR